VIGDNDEMIVVFRDAERERPGVLTVLIHFCVVVYCVVEGKILWRDYRKRSRLIECAKEKRSVECADRE